MDLDFVRGVALAAASADERREAMEMFRNMTVRDLPGAYCAAFLEIPLLAGQHRSLAIRQDSFSDHRVWPTNGGESDILSSTMLGYYPKKRCCKGPDLSAMHSASRTSVSA